MKREIALEKAKERVAKRNDEPSFVIIADMWNSYIEAMSRMAVCLEAKDVVAMMAMVEIARVATGKEKEKSWIDLAGYAACGCALDSKEYSVKSQPDTAGSFWAKITE